jgi:beta-xylosidase
MRKLRRISVAAAIVLLLTLAGAVPAWAGALRYANPLRDPATGRALSCPDPSVLDTAAASGGGGGGIGGWRYYLVCTSSIAPDAFPIRRSRDLVHWYPDGYVFPAGHQPGWALPSNGRTSGGHFWAPEIYRLGGRWVVYFAAEADPRKVSIKVRGEPAVGGQMVVGVATASRLSGPWQTRILHYRGQFDGLGGPREWLPGDSGGAIDPSLLTDPATGRLYLFWAVEHDQIWVGSLSADGLTLQPVVEPALTVQPGWECDPLSICTVEAPEPFYHDGSLYLLYSGASTWDASYAIGAATAVSPMTVPFTRLVGPLLHSGNGFVGPGHCSHPVLGPDGHQYILYHAQRRPSRVSSNRLVFLDRLAWRGGSPVIGNGVP